MKEFCVTRLIVCSLILSLLLSTLTGTATSFAGELNILGSKISWSEKMYISDNCSRYDFTYSNETGIRLLQIGFELNDPYGRNLISNAQVGIDSGKSGTWNMQICSKQFTNGLGPYVIKGIVKEYGSNQRQETREIYFLPLPGTPTVKTGAKCSVLKSVAINSGKKYTCIKSGSKLAWSNGVKISSPKASPISTSKPQATGNAGVVPASPLDYKVGDIGPGGGPIFYYKAGGFNCGPTLSVTCKYLEAAPVQHKLEINDYEFFQGCSYKYVFGQNVTEPIETGPKIGDGYKNTLLAISQKSNFFYPERSPAVIAQNYRGPKGLADWFVPSIDELRELHTQKNLVNARAGTRILADASYWSSSGAGGGYIALGIDFRDSPTSIFKSNFFSQKYEGNCIHLVRAF